MLKRIIITSGGSGGHIFPAIAIAEELLDRGMDILFVGNHNSMEEKIAGEKNIPFAAIDVQKLYRSLTFRHLLFPCKLLKSLIISRKIIKGYHPDTCIGTGGFVSGPVILCAGWQGIPVYIQEQNSTPGLTTRLLSRLAKRIFLGYESAQKYLPADKCLFSGNPLQNNFAEERQKKIDTSCQNTREKPALLVSGGSQGARTINDSVLMILPELLKMNISLLWQTGRKDFDRIKESLNKRNILFDSLNEKNGESLKKAAAEGDQMLTVFPFSLNMKDIYLKTDMALTRAGALSLAELDVMQIPAIIIPLSKSAGNHQYLNAKQQEEKKRAIVITQDSLSSSLLLESIQTLKNNLSEYKKNMITSEHQSATSTIVNSIVMDFTGELRVTDKEKAQSICTDIDRDKESKSC